LVEPCSTTECTRTPPMAPPPKKKVEIIYSYLHISQ
jgi:hypothetical protein